MTSLFLGAAIALMIICLPLALFAFRQAFKMNRMDRVPTEKEIDRAMAVLRECYIAAEVYHLDLELQALNGEW